MLNHVTPENSRHYMTRSGLRITDAHGDWTELTDGGDGSVLIEMKSVVDTTVMEPQEVHELIKYLQSVVDAATNQEVD